VTLSTRGAGGRASRDKGCVFPGCTYKRCVNGHHLRDSSDGNVLVGLTSFDRCTSYASKFDRTTRHEQENTMQIKEVMTEKVRTVRPDTRLPDVACLMRDEDIGSVPVEENDKLVGMITDRDIVLRAVVEGAEGIERHTARDVMSPKILYCRDDESIDDVLKNMGYQQIRRLPVVNREMRLVGIVSLGDLSRTAPPAETGESLKDISSPHHHHH